MSAKRIAIYLGLAAIIAAGVWFKVNRSDVRTLPASKDVADLYAQMAKQASTGLDADPYPQLTSLPPTLELVQNGLGIQTAAASRDGKFILIAGHDGVASLWDRATGMQLRALRGHDGSIDAAAFSRDATLVATAGQDRSIIVWNVADGFVRTILDGAGADIQRLAFLPDGTLLSAGWDAILRRWDVAHEKLQNAWEEHSAAIQGLATSPDGQRAATVGEDGRLIVWDLAGRRVDWRAAVGNTPAGSSGAESPQRLRDVVFSVDGSKIYVLPYVGPIWEYDTYSGDVLRTINIREPGSTMAGTAIAVHPSGHHLIVCQGPVLTMWTIGKEVSQQHSFQSQGSINSIVVEPAAGLLLASSGGQYDYVKGTWSRLGNSKTLVWDLNHPAEEPRSK